MQNNTAVQNNTAAQNDTLAQNDTAAHNTTDGASCQSIETQIKEPNVLSCRCNRQRLCDDGKCFINFRLAHVQRGDESDYVILYTAIQQKQLALKAVIDHALDESTVSSA